MTLNGGLISVKMSGKKDEALCPVCAKRGSQNRLETFHVNFDESVLMCPEPSCTYPIGVEPLSKVLNGPDGAPPVISPPSISTGSSMFAKYKNSYSSSVSTVSSLTGSISANPGIIQSSINSSILDASTLINQHLNLNDSLPTLNDSFLDDLFDPLSNDHSYAEVSVGEMVSVDTLNVRQNDIVLPQNDSDILEAEIELAPTDLFSNAHVDNQAFTNNLTNVSSISSIATTASVPPSSNASLESRTATLPMSSQSASQAEHSPLVSEQVSDSHISTVSESTNAISASVKNLSANVTLSQTVPQEKIVVTPEMTVLPSEPQVTVTEVPVNQIVYPQWKNKDSFCWLDVSMLLLTHCQYICNFSASLGANNLLFTLMKTYDRALELTNDNRGKGVHLETSLGHVVVKTGGGLSPRKLRLSALADEHPLGAANPIDPTITPMVSTAKEVDNLLNNIRETLWQFLQPKMRIERGNHDSPVFALPLLLGLEDVRQEFLVSYTWQMVCCHCGHHHEDRVEKIMPTFPNVPSDFSMLAPCFVRSCFKCNAGKQRINMVFHRLPPVVFVHFVEGISATSLEELDFQYRGSNYRVTGVVQYKTDHFVCWLRHQKEDLWRKCDDLEGNNTTFTTEKPEFPTKEVHIVMWEVIGECVHLKNEKSGQVSKPVKAAVKGFAALKSPKMKPVPKSAIMDLTSAVCGTNDVSNYTQHNLGVLVPAACDSQLHHEVAPEVSHNAHQVAAPVASKGIPVIQNQATQGFGNGTSFSSVMSIEQFLAPMTTSATPAVEPLSQPIMLPTIQPAYQPQVQNPAAGAAKMATTDSKEFQPIVLPSVKTCNQPQPIQPNVRRTSQTFQPIEPPTVAASAPVPQRNANDDRLQKIRNRLEQLKAANARRTSIKRGESPAQSPVASPIAHPAYVSNVANKRKSVSNSSTPTASPAPMPKTDQKKSYLAALQPFLQRKISTASLGLNSKQKQYSGYMTKAERAAIEQAKRSQDDQVALLFSNTSLEDLSKSRVSSVTGSPKKSVRFTGEYSEKSSKSRVKRRLEEPTLSQQKYARPQSSASGKSLKTDGPKLDISAAKKLAISQLKDLQIKPKRSRSLSQISKPSEVPKSMPMPVALSTPKKLKKNPSESNLPSRETRDSEVSKIAQENSVIDELMSLVFTDDSKSNTDSLLNVPITDSSNGLDPSLNSGLATPSLDDMFSMPSFF